MKKLLVILMLVGLVGCGEEVEEEPKTRLSVGPTGEVVFWGYGSWYSNGRRDSGVYNNERKVVTGSELYSIYKYWEENRPIYEKIIEEYKATHTKCDYCEKEFLTSELKEFSSQAKSNTGTYYSTKYICTKCKAAFKSECEAVTEKK